MNEADLFNVEFARRFPDAFARTSARGEPAEIAALLDSLPANVAASIAARLPSSRMTALLDAGLARPDAWLAAAAFDDAVALLGLLPRERCLALVNGIADRAKRRRLLQFLNYPVYSVGALVSDAVIRIDGRMPIAEVLEELRSMKKSDTPPAIILEKEGKYLGVLNLWRITVHGAEDSPAMRFTDRVPPLSPETPLSSAAFAEQWLHHGWLPVVDHEKRVLGMISRSRVFAHVNQSREAGPMVQDAIASLGRQFVGVMGEFMAWLLAPRNAS